MSIFVFSAVILAAMLHATWNALVKGGEDKYLGMTAVVLGHAPIAIVLLFFTPSPAAESWPYLIAGITLHAGYQLFLLYSYRIGDLTQVYPIARGAAPLLVAAVSVFLLGTELNRLELISVIIIGGGIISLTFVRQTDGLKNGRAAIMALFTGCFIAAYSLVDGLGARLADTALGFYAWLAVGNAVVFAILMAVLRPGTLQRVPSHAKRIFALGGSASFLAYALVIWAFTQAPIALVTALRESSIVFALLIGAMFLKERLDCSKVMATMIVLCGAALLKFSRT